MSPHLANSYSFFSQLLPAENNSWFSKIGGHPKFNSILIGYFPSLKAGVYKLQHLVLYHIPRAWHSAWHIIDTQLFAEWTNEWMNAELQALSSTLKYNAWCAVLRDEFWGGKGRLDNKDQFFLFSFPSLRIWEQALLRVAPSAMRQYGSWTKCSWVSRGHSERRRALHPIIPPNLSFTYSSFPPSPCGQGLWHRDGRARSDFRVQIWQRAQKHLPSCTKTHKERSRGTVTQAPD